jgi:8-oxo-dGTP pyrophosphatase MutT (NUDIX family)
VKYHRIGENGSKVKTKRGAGILFTDGQSLLLMQRSAGSHKSKWDFPGGGARVGETDIGAAMRETKEETGLEAIPGYRFESLVSHDGKKKFTVFLYRVSDQFQVETSDEHSDWDWTPIASLSHKDLHPKLEDNLPRYLKAIRRKIRSFSEWVEITECWNFVPPSCEKGGYNRDVPHQGRLVVETTHPWSS